MEQKDNVKFFEGQDFMKTQELEEKYLQAMEEGNMELANSLISSLLDLKQLNDRQRKSLMNRKLELQLKIGAFEDAKGLAGKMIEQEKNLGQTDKTILVEDLKLKIFSGQAQVRQGFVQDGLMEILRAQGKGVFQRKKNYKMNQFLKNKPDEFERNEKILGEIDEALLKLNVDSENQENVADYMHIQYIAQNNSSLNTRGSQMSNISHQQNIEPVKENLELLPELRNRMIRSISCGTNHSLILVDGCSCSNPYSPNPECKGMQECNGGSEVFGLGDNSRGQLFGFQTVKKWYDRPTNLSFFSEKKIIGVGTFSDKSFCYDIQGTIYTWGNQDKTQFNDDQKIEILSDFDEFKPNLKIKNVQKGNQFWIVQYENNEIYILGSIYSMTSQSKALKILDYNKPEKLEIKQQNIDKFQSFSIGANHITLIDYNNNVWVLGDNEFGQLGFINDDNKKFAQEFVQVKVEENEIFASAFSCQNCSFLVTSEGNVYQTGLFVQQNLDQTVIKQWEKLEIDFLIDEQILKVFYIPDTTQLYFISDLGKCYKKSQNKNDFNLIQSTEEQRYSFITGNQNFLIYYRTIFKPEKCEIEVKTKNPETYQPINFEIKIKDELGSYGLKMFYPLRVYCFLSDRNNMHHDQLSFLSQKTFRENIKKFKQKQFYPFELSHEMLKSIQISQNPQDYRIFDLQISVEIAEEYYLWVLINEKPLKNNPIFFEVQQSQKEKQLFMKECQNQLQKTEEQKFNQVLMEQQYEENLMKLEEREKESMKQKNYELRKKQQLSDEQRMAAINRQIQEIEKQFELCKIGGGYDIIAMAKLKKENQEIYDMKERLEHEIKNRKYYQLSSEQNAITYRKKNVTQSSMQSSQKPGNVVNDKHNNLHRHSLISTNSISDRMKIINAFRQQQEKKQAQKLSRKASMASTGRKNPRSHHSPNSSIGNNSNLGNIEEEDDVLERNRKPRKSRTNIGSHWRKNSIVSNSSKNSNKSKNNSNKRGSKSRSSGNIKFQHSAATNSAKKTENSIEKRRNISQEYIENVDNSIEEHNDEHLASTNHIQILQDQSQYKKKSKMYQESMESSNSDDSVDSNENDNYIQMQIAEMAEHEQSENEEQAKLNVEVDEEQREQNRQDLKKLRTLQEELLKQEQDFQEQLTSNRQTFYNNNDNQEENLAQDQQNLSKTIQDLNESEIKVDKSGNDQQPDNNDELIQILSNHQQELPNPEVGSFSDYRSQNEKNEVKTIEDLVSYQKPQDTSEISVKQDTSLIQPTEQRQKQVYIQKQRQHTTHSYNNFESEGSEQDKEQEQEQKQQQQQQQQQEEQEQEKEEDQVNKGSIHLQAQEEMEKLKKNQEYLENISDMNPNINMNENENQTETVLKTTERSLKKIPPPIKPPPPHSKRMQTESSYSPSPKKQYLSPIKSNKDRKKKPKEQSKGVVFTDGDFKSLQDNQFNLGYIQQAQNHSYRLNNILKDPLSPKSVSFIKQQQKQQILNQIELQNKQYLKHQFTFQQPYDIGNLLEMQIQNKVFFKKAPINKNPNGFQTNNNSSVNNSSDLYQVQKIVKSARQQVSENPQNAPQTPQYYDSKIQNKIQKQKKEIKGSKSESTLVKKNLKILKENEQFSYQKQRYQQQKQKQSLDLMVQPTRMKILPNKNLNDSLTLQQQMKKLGSSERGSKPNSLSPQNRQFKEDIYGLDSKMSANYSNYSQKNSDNKTNSSSKSHKNNNNIVDLQKQFMEEISKQMEQYSIPKYLRRKGYNKTPVSETKFSNNNSYMLQQQQEIYKSITASAGQPLPQPQPQPSPQYESTPRKNNFYKMNYLSKQLKMQKNSQNYLDYHQKQQQQQPQQQQKQAVETNYAINNIRKIKTFSPTQKQQQQIQQRLWQNLQEDPKNKFINKQIIMKQYMKEPNSTKKQYYLNLLANNQQNSEKSSQTHRNKLSNQFNSSKGLQGKQEDSNLKYYKSQTKFDRKKYQNQISHQHDVQEFGVVKFEVQNERKLEQKDDHFSDQYQQQL